jgi:hypothetical protein
MDNAYVFPAASRLVVHADDADGWWLTIELLGFNPTIDGYSAIQLGTTTLQDTDANLVSGLPKTLLRRLAGRLAQVDAVRDAGVDGGQKGEDRGQQPPVLRHGDDVRGGLARVG